MLKTNKPKGPKGPRGPKKPSKFSVLEQDNKILLKHFNMSTKSYKDVKQEETEDGLLLHDIPVFKAGRHREFDYSTQWIDKFLIGQFDSSEDIPIQRDHSDESYATLGYVKKLYRNGDMVYADMMLIDETAISRWKKGLMKKWSVGISREFKLAEISAVAFPYIKEARVHSDKEETEVLSMSLAKKEDKFLLTVQNEGFDLGESNSFSTFCNALSKGACLVRLDKDKNENIFANFVGEGEFKMNEEQLKKQIEDLQTQLKEANEVSTKKDADLSAKDIEIKKYKEAEEVAKFSALKASVEFEVKDLVKEGKITPAREKSLVETLCKMAEDSRKEMIQTFKEGGVIAELDESGHVKSKKEEKEFKEGEGKFNFDSKEYDLESMNAGQINDLADAYAKKNDLGFMEAMDVIYATARPKSE